MRSILFLGILSLVTCKKSASAGGVVVGNGGGSGSGGGESAGVPDEPVTLLNRHPDVLVHEVLSFYAASRQGDIRSRSPGASAGRTGQEPGGPRRGP